MTRSYGDLPDFPAWFFNLPPPNDSWPGARSIGRRRPPHRMRVHGYVTARDAGVLPEGVLPVVGGWANVDASA